MLEIRGCGKSWGIYDGDQRIGHAANFQQACARANNLEKNLRTARRRCLGCGQLFTSAGPENRLCKSCLDQRPNSDDSDARTDAKPVSLKIHIDQWVTGAPTRTRTADLLITNQLLYQLSYRGTSREIRQFPHNAQVRIAVLPRGGKTGLTDCKSRYSIALSQGV